MSTVLLHGLADSGQLHLVVSTHSLEALVGSSLVGVDHVLELSILLQVLAVALVAEVDHALHLSVHVSIHLSLSNLVLLDGVGKSSHAVVGLLHLLVHGGGESKDTGLEGCLSSLDA